MLNKGTVALNARKIEKLIRASGLKKSFLTREAGLNAGTLSKALRRGYARRTTLKGLADALKVRPEDLAA